MCLLHRLRVDEPDTETASTSIVPFGLPGPTRAYLRFGSVVRMDWGQTTKPEDMGGVGCLPFPLAEIAVEQWSTTASAHVRQRSSSASDSAATLVFT